MHLVGAEHVVPVAGVEEQVGLCAGIDAGTDEGEGVLRHAGGVVVAQDDLQATLQVLGLRQQAGRGIALGILLRRVHIALAVHHLVVFPVDDRSAGHAHLEDIGVGAHQVRGHEAAEAPAVDAQAVSVHVGQCLQELHAADLVLHLLVA